MLEPVMALSCDHPGCDKQARQALPGWRPPSRPEIDSFLLGCQSAGWVCFPTGSKELGAHYCPWHAHPADRIPPVPRDLGTPISELSGRPGHPGWDRFKAIAASWGYD